MTFLRPDFLFGLFALLIPLAIHLFNFRKYKKYYFSDISRLKNLTTKTRKQRNLKHLIVLLLRLLTIALVVMAISGPVINTDENEIKSSINTIIIDNSYSMLAEGESGRLLESARVAALSLANQSPDNDKFIILSQSSDASELKIFNKESATTHLEELKVSSSSKKISDHIRIRNRLLRKNDYKGGNTYIISDFQLNKADITQIPTDSISRFIFIKASHLNNRNLFIDSCSILNPAVMTNSNVSLKVWIRNESDTDFEKVPLRLLIDDEQKAVSAVNINAKSTISTNINFSVKEKGWHDGIIEIEDFPITFDDKLYFSFNAVDKINILIIGKKESNDRLVKFYDADDLFDAVEVNTREVDISKIKAYDLIILNEGYDLSTGLISRLKESVVDGSNLLFIPPSEQDTDQVNMFLNKLDLGRVNYYDSLTTRVTGIKRSDELFKNSIIEIPRNAELPQVNNHYNYYFPSSSGVESLITMLNGADFMTKSKMGMGSFYLLATSLDPSNTNFASQLLFSPVMHGIATKKKEADQLYYVLGVTNNLKVGINNIEITNKPLRLLDEQRSNELIPLQRNAGNQLILSIDNLSIEPGYYSLISGDTTLARISFNFNRDESKMEFADDKYIREACEKAGIDNFEIMDADEPELSEVINRLQKESDFWKLFIIFALVTLLAESMVLRYWK